MTPPLSLAVRHQVWLVRTCADMGRLHEAIEHGALARDIAARLEPDSKLFRFIWSSLGLAHYYSGDRDACEEIADFLKEYAEG